METNKVTQVYHTSDEDLKSTIKKTIIELFTDLTNAKSNSTDIVLLTRKEVAELLSVSLVTVDDWRKKGIISGYRIGNKIRFNKVELLESLAKIKS